MLVLRVGDTVFDAGLDISQVERGGSTIRPGSLLSVTGVYSYQGGPPPSFRLFLRSPGRRARARGRAVVDDAAHGGDGRDPRRWRPCVGAFWMRAIARRKRQQYQAVLNERTRVARELHDTVEQGLAGIALQLEAVAGSLQTAPERGAAVAGRRAADAALQPGGDAAVGDGFAIAGAREPRSCAARSKASRGR